MKTTSVSNSNYDKIYHKNTSPTQQTALKNNVVKDDVSFSGLKPSVGGLKGGVANIMGWIEKGGFLTEFLIVDTISMIIPRIVIGLGRDKEKTGKINYKAGAEEAGREILSGPSMMAIPMAIFAAAKQFAPSVKIPKETMQALSASLNDVINETATSETFKNVKDLNKTFANKLFDKAFGSFELDKMAELKSQFAEKLTLPSTKENLNAFEELIISINNKNKKTPPKDTRSINLGEKVQANAKNLFEDFKNYSNDIVNKFVKKDFAKGAIEDCKNEAKTFLKGLQKNRSNLRLNTSISSFFAIGVFLLYIPKLYQVGKTSPAEESAKLVLKDTGKGVVNESK